MAPEIFENSCNNLFACDVWALGVVFYKIYTESYPFKHWRENGKLITNFNLDILEKIDLTV